MENPKYTLEVFEGPLELLLKLIEKNKVKITDIPISLIFDQYMETIERWQRMDMEIAGEFIVMASELMLIKSKMLLPKPEEEGEDPRAALAAALAEYKRMKAAALGLSERYADYSGRFMRETDEVKPESGRLDAQSVAALRGAMLRVMRSLDKERVAKVNKTLSEQPFERILRTPIVPVAGKIFGVIRYLVKNGDCLYTSILLTAKTRSELIATFLAVLELIKKNRVTLRPIGDVGFDDLPDDYSVTLNRGKLRDDS